MGFGSSVRAGTENRLTFGPHFITSFLEADLVLDGTFQTLFTFSGVGCLIGAVITFDGKEPEVRVITDTFTHFSLTLQQIDDAQITSGSDKFTGGGPQVFGNQFLFMPSKPIEFETGLTISAMDVGGKKRIRQMINLLEEPT